jgi:hypothetical protein
VLQGVPPSIGGAAVAAGRVVDSLFACWGSVSAGLQVRDCLVQIRPYRHFEAWPFAAFAAVAVDVAVVVGVAFAEV